MSLDDILLYFAAETTPVQVLRFKQTYLCDIPDLAHQLINVLSFFLFFFEVCYKTLENIDEFVMVFLSTVSTLL